MFKRLDRSKILIDALARLSSLLARQRGLPIVIGLILFAIGGFLQFINVAVDSQTVELIHIILQNVGVITALIGILLMEPLGK